jgi:hypothetical protein
MTIPEPAPVDIDFTLAGTLVLQSSPRSWPSWTRIEVAATRSTRRVTSSRRCWNAQLNPRRDEHCTKSGSTARMPLRTSGDLRSLLASIRPARQTAVQTAELLISTDIQLAPMVGITIKLKIFGLSPLNPSTCLS